jgi:hypothetical protein
MRTIPRRRLATRPALGATVPRAYENAAVEVCDPERIRANAVPLGKASQAIEPRDFLPLLEQVYGGVADVRSDAITAPAHSAAKAPRPRPR